MNRARIAVLASGGGSNLQALLNHLTALGDARAADVVLVASDRPSAGALTRAHDANIPTATISSSRAPLGEDPRELLHRASIDFVILAGYLQLVPRNITRQYVGRVLNVHPGPLPDLGGPGMYGARVHRAVLAAGVSMSGPTVHFVDEQYDNGAIIAYWPVPVLEHDDEHVLASRVLRAEHLLFPRVVQAVAIGDVSLCDDGLVAPPFFRDSNSLTPFDPALDDASLGQMLDRSRDAQQLRWPL